MAVEGHCRREFGKLLNNDGSTPLTAEAIKRIGAFYAIEVEIRGALAATRHAARQERTAPLMAEFRRWPLEAKAHTSTGQSTTHSITGLA
jgi:transposase